MQIKINYADIYIEKGNQYKIIVFSLFLDMKKNLRFVVLQYEVFQNLSLIFLTKTILYYL